MEKYVKTRLLRSLGVSKNASEAGSEKAYRRLAMKYHRTETAVTAPQTQMEKFKEAKEAYEVLSDPRSAWPTISSGMPAWIRAWVPGQVRAAEFQ